MTRWCIDEEQTVHHTMCRHIVGRIAPYVSKPKTDLEMSDHLARADRKDGHDLPGTLFRCEGCIPDDEPETP